MQLGPENGPEDFQYSTDEVYTLSPMHRLRLNKVWENFVDDWCIRTGRFSDGEPVTEAEYLKKRANVPTTARVGENDRTLEDALRAAGYATGGPAATARLPEAKDEEAEVTEERELDIK